MPARTSKGFPSSFRERERGVNGIMYSWKAHTHTHIEHRNQRTSLPGRHLSASSSSSPYDDENKKNENNPTV